MKTIEKEFTVICIVDRQGNTWMGAAGDLDNDALNVEGLKVAEDGRLFIKANVKDIIWWCMENGLGFHVQKRIVAMEIPG